ncbi:MAG: flavodoxin domain-containing protein [Actinobacteria bacterium]|nr:flavodoxin domain-containing protein [Actinomycetota bacterium]
MGAITILFGTESGNAEVAADDIAAALAASELETEIVAMDELDLGALTEMDLAIVVTSTYGDGELPMTALPFYEALTDQRPDLSSLRFAAFGLGDSVYDTYNNAIDLFVELMVELGAEHAGDVGRHDASGTESYAETAEAWVRSNVEILSRAADKDLRQAAG